MSDTQAVPTEEAPESVIEQGLTLAEAMRRGIQARPKAARGVYFAGEDRSDALGAAFQGATGKSNEDVHNHLVGNKLELWFPILAESVSHPETGTRMSLKKVIRELNDVQCWKRRNIARFVESVEGRNN